MSIHEKYLKPGDFIQVMCDGGSYYGYLVEIEMPWVVFTDHGDGDTTVMRCPEKVSFIVGDGARRNLEKANEHQTMTKGMMGMVERTLSGADQQ